jgi:outer membrane protein assembly factor BamB
VVAAAVLVTGTAITVVDRRADGRWGVEATGGGTRLVADDRTVCSATHEELFCLDAASGEERFATRSGTRAELFSIVDGTLLVGDSSAGGDGRLHAYSLDGERLWDASLQQASLVEPPVAAGVVAIPGGSPSEVVGLDLVTGDERWRTVVSSADGGVSLDVTGPMFSDGQAFYASVEPHVGLSASGIVALDAESGRGRWQSEIPLEDLPAGNAAPFEDGSAIAFVLGPVGQHHRIVALDTATGRLRWQAPLSTAAATVAHVDGVTMVLSGDDLRGYDADGDELWTADAPDDRDDEARRTADTETSLLGNFVARGRLYLVSRHVHEIDPHTGQSRTIQENVADAVPTADHLVVVDDSSYPDRIEGRPR